MKQSIDMFENLADRPGHLVRRLHQIHVGLFLEESAKYDLTPVQFGVLTVLADGAIRDQVTVAALVGVDRNTAADVIRRLAGRGLLERPSNPSDKRTKMAKITEAGREMVKTVQPGMITAQFRFVEPLSDEEYRQFMALAGKLIDANDHSSRAPWRPLLESSKDDLALSE